MKNEAIFLVIFMFSFINSFSFEEIDIVYTWVNGTLDQKNKNRYRDNEELKFSLRSIEKYLPTFRNVYIITNGQIPNWLNLTHPKIKIIFHKEIFKNLNDLPTFNSASIEFNIHHIKNLSEYFIYFNDDMMLGNFVTIEDYFSHNKYQIYFSYEIPNCNEGCTYDMLGDGICHTQCNTSICNYDENDCLKDPLITIKNECSKGCTDFNLGNGVCNKECNNENCGFDLDDCNNNYNPDVYIKQKDERINFSSKTNFLVLQYLYIPNFDEYKIDIEKNRTLRKFKKKFNLLLLSLYDFKENFVIKLIKNNKIDIKVTVEFKISQFYSLDFYVTSLLYTNYFFNKNYFKEKRYVISHMPILLNKEIIKKAEEKFPKEFEQTISSKERSNNNLQFQLFYHYFLMYSNYSYEISIQNQEVDFVQVDDFRIHEIKDLELKKIFKNKKKFICLNDNLMNDKSFLNYGIDKFYYEYFPYPSSFEKN